MKLVVSIVLLVCVAFAAADNCDVIYIYIYIYIYRRSGTSSHSIAHNSYLNAVYIIGTYENTGGKRRAYVTVGKQDYRPGFMQIIAFTVWKRKRVLIGECKRRNTCCRGCRGVRHMKSRLQADLCGSHQCVIYTDYLWEK